MIELTKKQITGLGLDLVSDLSGLLAEDSHSYHVRDQGGRPAAASKELVLKVFGSGVIDTSTALWDTGRWSTRGAGDWKTRAHGRTAQQDKLSGMVSEDRQIELLKFNWLLGEYSLGKFCPPVLEVGVIDGAPYLIREHFPKTVLSLIQSHAALPHQFLVRLADSIWAGLSFLHQPGLNLPHGNLKASNILIGDGLLGSAPLLLCDARTTLETKTRAEKIKDLKAFGVILLQLISGSADDIPLMEGLARAETLDYDSLKKDGPKWRDFLCHLFDDANYPSDFHTEDARLAWLAPVRSSKSSKTNIPLPAPASPAGPPLGGNATKEKSQEFSTKIDELIAEKKFGDALQVSLQAMRSDLGDKSALLERLNFCAAKLSEDDLSDSSLLVALEEASRLGASSASLRLGLAMIAVDRLEEAIDWLADAHGKGEIEAFAPLAQLYENGTESTPSDAEKALEILEQLAEQRPGPEQDYRIAALILRGKSSHPADSAIPYLERASAQGHFRATDLLGQCYATGLGAEIDEKRAYQLFAESWKASKDSAKEKNERYFTAANNLGVCLALGFGIPADRENARLFFQQGAMHQHAASEENLRKLS